MTNSKRIADGAPLDMRSVWGEEIDWKQELWRYFKVSRFVSLLETSKLYFAASTQFTDKFEGAAAVLPPDFPVDPRYQDMDHTERAYFDWKYLNKINCWHRADYESNAMWRLYGEESKGIAICSSPARMKEAIKPYYVHNPNYPEILWAGNIRYHDFLKVRLRPASHQRYFTKHQAFAWEKEFRLMISMMEAHKFGVNVVREGIEVSIDLDKLIEKIMLGPELTQEDQKTIIKESHKQGFDDRVCKSSLMGTPRFL